MRKLFLILSLCIVTQYPFISGSAVYGDSVSDLEEKISFLRDQNQRLEVEIASLASCTKISQRAVEAGLTHFSVALKR